MIRLILATVVTLGVLTLGVVACGNAHQGSVAASATSASASSGASASAGSSRVAGLKDIAVSQLPSRARQTLKLIDAGGPYPYRQDGTVFQNREKLLPLEPAGYYREFTVAAPGARDRGSRRIIAGKDGERYYTPDHYQSFLRIEGIP
jgi:ribonuclease T1